MTLDPENKRIISVPSGFIDAKDFYACVRGLENKLLMAEAGIDDITPYDKFFITMAKHLYTQGAFYSGGTANTPPEDVLLILNKLFGK